MLPPCVPQKNARFAAEKYTSALRRSDLDVRESHPRGASLYARRRNYSRASRIHDRKRLLKQSTKKHRAERAWATFEVSRVGTSPDRNFRFRRS